MEFYVYIYLDLDNIPFYVGKGKGPRYTVKRHLDKYANDFLKNKIRKVGVNNIKIHFLHKNLTEKEALQKEIYWIKYYGRRDLKQGSLCNLTDGGEGSSGWICPEETKEKISKALKGRSSINKGRVLGPLSDVCRQKISIALEGRSAWNKGKKTGPRSEKIRRKISKSHKGILHTAATKFKISETKKGVRRNYLRDNAIRFLYINGASYKILAQLISVSTGRILTICKGN